MVRPNSFARKSKQAYVRHRIRRQMAFGSFSLFARVIQQSGLWTQEDSSQRPNSNPKSLQGSRLARGRLEVGRGSRLFWRRSSQKARAAETPVSTNQTSVLPGCYLQLAPASRAGPDFREFVLLITALFGWTKSDLLSLFERRYVARCPMKQGAEGTKKSPYLIQGKTPLRKGSKAFLKRMPSALELRGRRRSRAGKQDFRPVPSTSFFLVFVLWCFDQSRRTAHPAHDSSCKYLPPRAALQKKSQKIIQFNRW